MPGHIQRMWPTRRMWPTQRCDFAGLGTPRKRAFQPLFPAFFGEFGSTPLDYIVGGVMSRLSFAVEAGDAYPSRRKETLMPTNGTQQALSGPGLAKFRPLESQITTLEALRQRGGPC